MKAKFIVFSLAAIALCMTSCQTSKKSLNSLRDLTADIRDNGSTYTISDWKKAGEKYKDLNTYIVKHNSDYTQKELSEIGTLNGQCVGYFAKGVTTNVVSKASSAASVLQSIISGFKGAVGK